jgi:Protein of unknown function (DUF2442)
MSILTAIKTDERVKDVQVTSDALTVFLFDGRAISVPLFWYPRLFKATVEERSDWKPCGGGYGIYWPTIDEHLSVDGLLHGAPSPELL